MERELLQARGLRRRATQPPGRRRRHGGLAGRRSKPAESARPPTAPRQASIAITAVRSTPPGHVFSVCGVQTWPHLPVSPIACGALGSAAPRGHYEPRLIQERIYPESLSLSGDRRRARDNAAAGGAGAGAAGPALRPLPPVEPLRAVLGPRRRHLRQLQGVSVPGGVHQG